MSSGADGPGNADSDIENAIEKLFRDGRTNAILAWVMTSVLVFEFVESVLDIDYGWMLFVGFVGFVVVLPPVSHRDWRVMLPWDLLFLALFPILVRGLARESVGTFATYFALAALALLVVAELHMFTSMDVTHWFAIVLVVMTTLAAAAAWSIFRWNADQYLGTAYLTDNEALMMEWVYVTLAGFGAGILFDGYFKRRNRRLWRAIRRTVRR